MALGEYLDARALTGAGKRGGAGVAGGRVIPVFRVQRRTRPGIGARVHANSQSRFAWSNEAARHAGAPALPRAGRHADINALRESH
jgi:hypothetical protein